MAGVVTGSVSRTLLGMGALAIGSSASSVYQAGELLPDGVAWDRITAQSVFAHGRTLRAARKVTSSLSGQIVVVTPLDSDPSVHEGNVSALVEALSQFAYTVTLIVTDDGNSQSWTYACEPADVSPEESINVYGAYRLTTVNVSIPHHPVPDSGAW